MFLFCAITVYIVYTVHCIFLKNIESVYEFVYIKLARRRREKHIYKIINWKFNQGKFPNIAQQSFKLIKFKLKLKWPRILCLSFHQRKEGVKKTIHTLAKGSSRKVIKGEKNQRGMEKKKKKKGTTSDQWHIYNILIYKLKWWSKFNNP